MMDEKQCAQVLGILMACRVFFGGACTGTEAVPDEAIRVGAAGTRHFMLAPGTSRSLACRLPDRESGSRVFVALTGRLVIPAGEGWGEHALRLEFDGIPVSPEHGPLNKLPTLIDSAFPDRPSTDLFDAARAAWFLRYDADDVPYNATVQGDPYNRAGYFGGANVGVNKRGFRDAHYRYVFELNPVSADAAGRLTVSNLSSRFAMALSVACVNAASPCFFAAPPGAPILPWTFPDLDEIAAPLRAKAAPRTSAPLALSCRNLDADDIVFRVEPPELRTPAGHTLAADRFVLRTVGYRAADNPRPLEYRPGADDRAVWPHRLIRSDRFAVKAGETATHWMTVTIPADQPPGVYRGDLRLHAEGRPPRIYPVEIEVLPFALAETDIVFGLWDDKVRWPPNEKADAIVADWKAHGINATILSPWTAPVGLSRLPSGEIRVATEGLEDMLRYLVGQGLNRTHVPYGVLDPLAKRVAELTGSQPGEEDFDRAFGKVVEGIRSAAEALNINLYFHPVDEPDLHPRRWETYRALCRTIRRAGGRVWSNNTIAGARLMDDENDAKIVLLSTLAPSFEGRAYENPFYREWGAVPPEWVRSRYDTLFVQTQARGFAPLQTRLHYGLMPALTSVRGVWGFCYHWNEAWHVGWPFPDGDDGALGSTVGWEMLREGIYDYRYLLTLKKRLRSVGREVAPAALGDLPPLSETPRLDMQDLARLRERIVAALLDRVSPTMAPPSAPAVSATPFALPRLPATGAGKAPLPIAAYAVSPGSYYRAAGFGTRYDADLRDRDAPQAGRRGWLTDDQRGNPAESVTYAFWRVPAEESHITVECDLAVRQTVSRVRIEGHNSTDLYGIRAVHVHASDDGVQWERIGEAGVLRGDRRGPWEAEVAFTPIAARHLRLVAFSIEDRWLRLVQIEAWGTDNASERQGERHE